MLVSSARREPDMAWLMLPYEGVNGTNSTTTPLITTGRVPHSFGQSSKIAGSSRAPEGTRDGGNHRRRGLHRTVRHCWPSFRPSST